MKITKLISQISSYILIGFVLADTIWYSRTSLSFVSSKYLFFGTIWAGLIYAVFYTTYLIQSKNYKELRQFFICLIIAIVAIYALGNLL
jgi:hypothetical protein